MDSLKILERLVREKASEKDIITYLADEVTFTELAKDYYKLYQRYNEKEKEITPIRISIDEYSLIKKEFSKYFRIKGYRSDGTPEGRGSKRWKKEQ